MKYLLLFGIILIFLSGLLSKASAMKEESPVTPYGDFCPRCTKYGNCETTMTHEDAKKAMIEYYHKKGLGVELEKKRGRFIRAKIKDRDEVIDVIIFDRRTGRIRSIY